MRLQLQIDQRSRALLQKLRKIVRDFAGNPPVLAAAFRDCGVVCLNDLRVRFLQNSAGGGEWKPLAPSTLKKKTPRRGILRVTDRLYESLRPKNPDNILRVTRGGVSYGSKTPYGKYHQDSRRRSLPRRKFLLPPSPDAKARCKAVLTKAVKQILEQ
jgi:hypothetical protein